MTSHATDYIAEYEQQQWRRSWDTLPVAERLPRLGCCLQIDSRLGDLDMAYRVVNTFFDHAGRIRIDRITVQR